VVLNYRTPHETAGAVQSLQGSDRPAETLIVVDNGSADGSPELLRALLPGVTVLETATNLGFSGGCNAGIRQALGGGADLVFLVNSDLVVAPRTLGQLERALGESPDAGIVGPVVLARSEPDRVSSAGIVFSPVTGRMRHVGAGQRLEHLGLPPTRVVDGVSGCAMLVRREVFEAIGLLDEDYFFSFEDLDFCLRAGRRGFSTVLAGDALSYHQGSRSIGKRSTSRIYFATRNHLRLASRLTPPHPVLAALRAAWIVALNLAFVLVRGETPRWRALGAVGHGVWDHLRRRYGDRS
jgi:hypothetical protein